MSEITEEMFEDFVYGTSNIELTLGYYGLELDNRGGGEVDAYDGEVEIYAITTDLTLSDFEKLPREWEEFVNFEGNETQLEKQAEELQIILKEHYNDDYLDIAHDISSDLLVAFEGFVANNHEDVEDFEHDFDFYVYPYISDNSFNPEDLIQAREEELSVEITISNGIVDYVEQDNIDRVVEGFGNEQGLHIWMNEKYGDNDGEISVEVEISNNLWLNHFEETPEEWLDFVYERIAKSEIQARAEKLQETLTDLYVENELHTMEGELAMRIADDYRKWAEANSVKESDVDNLYITATILINHNNAFYPEGLIDERRIIRANM